MHPGHRVFHVTFKLDFDYIAAICIVENLEYYIKLFLLNQLRKRQNDSSDHSDKSHKESHSTKCRQHTGEQLPATTMLVAL